jgi:hypothetical protein
VFPDLPPDVLLARALGLNYPILSGLIAWTWAGLPTPGDPEAAYEAAFRADFYDIGYARETVALLAAAVSLAVTGEYMPYSLYEELIAMDPLHLGSEWSAPYVIDHLPRFTHLLEDRGSDREIARAISVAFRRHHPFDAFRTFAVALLSVLAAGPYDPSDVRAHSAAHARADVVRPSMPLRAILIAANHVGIDDRGQATRYEDIDCYAALAGAIAGALWGAESLPAKMLDVVIEANKQVYGIDLEATTDRFVDTIFE